MANAANGLWLPPVEHADNKQPDQAVDDAVHQCEVGQGGSPEEKPCRQKIGVGESAVIGYAEGYQENCQPAGQLRSAADGPIARQCYCPNGQSALWQLTFG